MARARNIKPSFFTNELLGTYEPIISMLFAGLWCLADKEGILEDRPLRIKAELFPYRESVDVNGYLTVLERDGFLVRYEVAETRYIKIINFEKHQSPHHTEKAKGYPKPPADIASQRKCELTPLSNGENTVSTRSDSLIPDSLIQKELKTIPTLQVGAECRLNGKTKMIEEVISYLNKQARRQYRAKNPKGEPTAYALLVEQRLKDGYTVEQLKDVVGVKSNEWMGDEKMDKHLNPGTLFRKANFEKYLAEAEAQ